jgi:hypothetical protein
MSIDEIKSQNIISDFGPNLKIAFIIGTAIVSPITGTQSIEFDENIPFSQQIYSGQEIESDILSALNISAETSDYEKIAIIQQFARKLTDGIEELNSDIIKLVDDNFWELG